MHLVPARHPARRHPGVEQLVGALAAARTAARRRGAPRASGRPARRGTRPWRPLSSESRRSSQACPTLTWVTTSNVRPRASADGQLGERLEAAAEARRRPADALGDRLELADARRDERQDAVRLAQVEARQDDGIGGVAARDGHRGDGTTDARPIRRRTRAIRSRDPRRVCPVVDAGAVASPAPASHRRPARRPRRDAHSTGYLRRTRFVYTRPTMTDLDRHRPRPRSSPTPRRRSSASSPDRDPSTHGLYEMVRYHLALDGSGASGGKRIRPLLGLLAYASIAGEHAAGAARRRGRRARPQLQPRPRRHRGRRRRAPPPPDAVDRPRHPAGDQHRRHAVQPVADRPPPADRPRLLGRQGPAPDAPVRRDVPRAVRGPVHRHRGERLERADDASTATST